MWGRGVFGGIMLAALMGACAVVDPVDNRYDNIGRSLAKARNESIFLNIVRASHDYPLSFTTIGSVTPSMTNTSGMALPSFLLGPSPRNVEPSFTPGRDVVFGNTTASNSLAVSSNFNISTQETSQFYNGFLKPVDLTILDYFIRQGYSRELLFWMFADSFQFGPFGYQYNPPYDYGCPIKEPKRRCFREMVQIAVLLGLSVETKTIESSGGGGKGAAKQYGRFCFDRILAQRSQAAMRQVDEQRLTELKRFEDHNASSPTPICGSAAWTPESTPNGEADTLTFKIGVVPVTIQPRSAYSMFQFLGTLIKLQRSRDRSPNDAEGLEVYVPREEERDLPTLATMLDDRNLLTVTKNFTGECFVHTWFSDGDYCVPDNAANTKRIFSMLAQLIAIQTQANGLSITPSVRIIQ